MHIWGFNLHIRETNQAIVCAPACPSALSAASHQSRALTNFGKPGRDRLHSASPCAVNQPTWSCSVISPVKSMTSCWKVKEQWCPGTGRLDTLFSPYCRRLVQSVQKMALAAPPPFPIFVSSLCPVVQSIKASARLFVCACIGVSGCVAPFPLAGLSWSVACWPRLLKILHFTKKGHAVDSQQFFPPIMNICVSFPVKLW